MHNYVRSASAFERQQHEGRKNILIVSSSVTWQYRCPSYNQQRERGGKNNSRQEWWLMSARCSLQTLFLHFEMQKQPGPNERKGVQHKHIFTDSFLYDHEINTKWLIKTTKHSCLPENTWFSEKLLALPRDRGHKDIGASTIRMKKKSRSRRKTERRKHLTKKHQLHLISEEKKRLLNKVISLISSCYLA